MRQILLAVVLCAVHLSLAADPTKVTLTIEDKNHDLVADRELEITCKYEGGDLATLAIYKDAVAPATPSQIYKQEANKAGVKGDKGGDVADEFVIDEKLTDNRNAKVTLKKIKKDAIAGKYYCVVPDTVSGKKSDTSPELFATTDTVHSHIESKQSVESKDDSLKEKFRKDDQLNVECPYSVATGNFVKLEFLKGTEVYYEYVKKAEDRHKKSIKGIEDKQVDFVADTDNKVQLTIKNAVEDTAGEFSCDLTHDGTTKLSSNKAKIEYKSGAATTMVSFASISTLLMAFAFVRSNF
jgi:hypothetical protein